VTVVVAGAGAFGTALAVTEARAGRPVVLWSRDPEAARAMRETRRSPRLPAVALPEAVRVTDAAETFRDAEAILLAIPAQALRPFLRDLSGVLAGRALIACGKGIDLATLTGPTAVIAAEVPSAVAAMLTGPGFAEDIARGLPTALTLACRDSAAAARLQERLATPALRLYRTTDTVGAELGGALKNVIAIACGACMGAGLGDSARAALMTRGFAEMRRLGAALGADPATLAGLSGFGDLVLTCTSARSRNFAHGFALGRGRAPPAGVTVEGIATSRAAALLGRAHGLDLPITDVVALLTEGRITVAEALDTLLSRPLKEE
jgi:glycerol-3-phosphate dehydrogenase (NAD(P)+)